MQDRCLWSGLTERRRQRNSLHELNVGAKLSLKPFLLWKNRPGTVRNKDIDENKSEC